MNKTTITAMLTAVFFNSASQEDLFLDKGTKELGGVAKEISETAEVAADIILTSVDQFAELTTLNIMQVASQLNETIIVHLKNDGTVLEADSNEWANAVKLATHNHINLPVYNHINELAGDE